VTRPAGVGAAVAVLFAASLAMGGCWNLVPIEDRGLVSMLAIDTAPGGRYRATAAVLHPPGLPPPGPTGQGGGAGAEPVLLRSAASTDMALAVQALQASTYLQLDYTHLEALVVSEPVARAGLGPLLTALAQTPQYSLNSWLLVARGTSAADLLEATKQDLPQPNEVLSRTVRHGRWGTVYFGRRLFTLIKLVPVDGDAFVTAGVTAPRAGAADPIAVPVRLDGLALFRGARLVGWLSGNAALGWRAATGRLHHQTLVVGGPGHGFDLQLVAGTRSVAIANGPRGPGGRLTLRVTAHLSNIHEPAAASNVEPSLTPAAVRSMEAAAASALRRDVEAALREARDSGSDPFGFGEYVRLRDPRYWEGARSTWNARGFGRFPVQVHVEVTMRSVGNVVCSIIRGC
jgi:spore germination protein KC